MESAPGCWSLYGEVLVREYTDATYAAHHRLTVDAYAIQHPGQRSPQSIQSVAVHLVSLCLIFELGVAPARATLAIQRVSKAKSQFVWLSPPDTMGQVTVASVHAARSATQHLELVRTWAESAWHAWAGHHRTVRQWLPRQSGWSSDAW